jgi:outer membrane biosynthesis protein TonB
MERADAAGFGVSVVGHCALLAAAWLVVTRSGPLPVAPPAIEVSYVDEVGLTAASPNPAPSAQASVAPEVAPPAETAPAPVPEAVPEPTPAPPRQAPRPAPSPRATPAPPARPAPPRATRQQGSAAAQRNTGSLLGPHFLRGIGNDRNARSNSPPAATYGAAERASVRQAIGRALMRCQRQPLPAPEAAAIRVNYRVTLNPDGSLASAQFLNVMNDDPALERYERRMRDLGMNVLRACTPIHGLPAQFYDVPGGWRSFPYQFDPRTVR